jgi:putative nucleotidyltransferase with HDIG domain
MERRPTEPLTALGRLTDRGWLVGGAVRDQLLGRATTDLDVAVETPVEELRPLAHELARTTGGFAFALSEAFGAWRVLARDRGWQLDLMPLEGGSIEADLGRRDFTINAMAQPLAAPDGLIDPSGGRRDLEERRLRAVSPSSFSADPLRVLRLARLAAELEFEVAPATSSLARAAAAGLDRVAPERIFAELRLVVAGDRPLSGLSVMDAVGATSAVLPELGALQGIEQSRFHHLDVFGHTRAVLTETLALEREPEAVFGAGGTALRDFMSRPLANDLSRWQALRFGALLHDIAKPLTRAQTPEGRVTFMRHDETGAELAAAILLRLRASERLTQHVAALTRHHLRLGFLVHEEPLDRREVYRYLKASEGVAVDVTVLSVADRLATRGDDSERAIARHLDLARRMLPDALTWSAQPPRPPLRGDELSAALGLAPGPQLGALLDELEEAAYAGEVRSPQEAIGYARRRLDG